MPLFPTFPLVVQSSSLPTLTPLPGAFFVVPLQFGNTDSHGERQYPTLGSVKHEGLQPENGIRLISAMR